MNTNDISKLITEEIHFNNGLLCEDTSVTGTIDISELNSANFPFISKDVVLPTWLMRKNINKDNLYAVLQTIAKDNGGKLTYKGQQGGYYSKSGQAKLIRQAMSDIGYAATVVNIAMSFSDKEHDLPIEDIIAFTSKRRGARGGMNPEDWARAVRDLAPPELLIKDLPELFENYFGMINNTAGVVLLASGVYGEGLYILPVTVKIGDKVLDWDSAIDMFSANPSAYINVEKGYANIAERIRLLFRKYMQETNQGVYLDRASLSPQDTIELFGAASSLEEFVGSFGTRSESYERLEALFD